MKLISKLKPEGILKIYKVKGIEKTLIFKEKNLITLSAKQSILSFLYLPAITSDPINSLWVGTGGTIDPEGLFPKIEDASQTSLNTPLLNISTTYTTDLAIPSVTFLADLDTGTGNGNLISEAALYRSSNQIFNVKNFPAVPKTSDFGLHFNWTIKFA
jgi:hypothetical protein